MPFVSITRLRIRGLRFMPAFLVHTLGALRQVRAADGFRAGSLLRDRDRAFWTMTLWESEADMRRYMTGGAHRAAMPKLLHWCDEASVVHWRQDSTDLPAWTEADRRMRTEGRPSKVRYPTRTHRDLAYRWPRTGRATAIRRRGPVRGRPASHI